MHPYDMRHTAATIVLNDGVPLAEVSRPLGHKDTRTTLVVYSGTTEED